MKDDSNHPGDADAQEVDLDDVDVSATPESGLAGRRTAPPPLPMAISTSQPSAVGSQPANAAPPPPAKRTPMFYAMLIVAFVVVGVGVGAGVAVYVRRAPAAAPAPTATPSPAVITIPTVEMDDQDSGP